MAIDGYTMPTGTHIDRQTKSAVQRWQEPKPMHETGAVSPVPLVVSGALRQPGRALTLTKLNRHHKSRAKGILPKDEQALEQAAFDD